MLFASFATTSHEILKIDDLYPPEKPFEFFNKKFDYISSFLIPNYFMISAWQG